MSDELTAYQLLKEGSYQQAKEILKELIEVTPEEYNLFNFALCLYKLGELEEALEILEKLLDKNPEHKKGLFLKGVILRRLGELEKAKEIFMKLEDQYLAETIPEPIEKPKREEALEPEITVPDETPSEEELEVSNQEDYKGDIVRIKIDGSFEIEKKHFVAFLFKEGNLSETNVIISGSGNGELIVAGFSLPEGDITQDKGEGQLLVDLEDETFALKVNKDEQLYFQASLIIHWRKL